MALGHHASHIGQQVSEAAADVAPEIAEHAARNMCWDYLHWRFWAQVGVLALSCAACGQLRRLCCQSKRKGYRSLPGFDGTFSDQDSSCAIADDKLLEGGYQENVDGSKPLLPRLKMHWSEELEEVAPGSMQPKWHYRYVPVIRKVTGDDSIAPLVPPCSTGVKIPTIPSRHSPLLPSPTSSPVDAGAQSSFTVDRPPAACNLVVPQLPQVNLSPVDLAPIASVQLLPPQVFSEPVSMLGNPGGQEFFRSPSQTSAAQIAGPAAVPSAGCCACPPTFPTTPEAANSLLETPPPLTFAAQSVLTQVQRRALDNVQGNHTVIAEHATS